MGLIAFFFAIACVILGIIQLPWWTIFILGVIGVPLYFGIRPGARQFVIERGGMTYFFGLYICQVITTGILFLIGFGIGALF